MTTTRLFSDGVLAILITAMELGLRISDASTLSAVTSVLSQLAINLVSLVYLVIDWTNHHSLFQNRVEKKSLRVWANFGLLFVLSLVPPVTEWAGHHPDAPWPTAVHGSVLLGGGVAYLGLERSLVERRKSDVHGSRQSTPVWKPVLSLAGYVFGAGLSFGRPWLVL